MSFQVPQNVPSFSSVQRPYEDSHWRAAHRGNGHAGGVGSKLNEFFREEKELPMYKDKPNARRKRGYFKRKRMILFGVLALLFLFWLFRSRKHVTPELTLEEEARSLWEHIEKADPKYPKASEWEARRESVREAFLISWEGYEKYAWGLDEYHPISKKGRNMVEGGLGWIIVDALDTAMIMNLTSCVKHARDWIATSLHYTANHEVNTFETTIRMLGGLLSAHYISTTYPNLAPLREDDTNQPGEDLYIEKATDLADRIIGAFESPSGIPYASFNLNTSTGVAAHAEGGASSTAEASTLQLEFKYLAKLTGEPHYWAKAERVMAVVDGSHMPDGLLPIYIYPATGGFRGENIRLGSRGDSYYEYLIKQYLQTSGAESVYLDMWNEALAGMKKHLITYTRDAQLTIIAERPSGLSNTLSPKMDHLVCFMPGTIALGVTGGRTVAEAKKSGPWTAADEENMSLARELMKTCWATYRATSTGLAPEITYFEIDNPPLMYNAAATTPKSHGSRLGTSGPVMGPQRPISKPLDDAEDAAWRSDIVIHANDEHNLQRPETVESLFYMWRITGDEIYREWGWDMFKSFVKNTAYPPHLPSSLPDSASEIYAFTSINSVKPHSFPPTHRDNMESFWLAETLKYFYLLFSPNELLPLDQTVINTEAHFMPRFEMGKGLKTGWQRNIRKEEQEPVVSEPETVIKVQKVEKDEAEIGKEEETGKVGRVEDKAEDKAEEKAEEKSL